MWLDPTFLSDFVVKFLNIRCGKIGELFIADKAFDLMLRDRSVSVHCFFFDFEYHILVEPFVHPFAERHAAFFGEVDVAVEVDKQMKLFQRRFLALSEHRFIHRRTVFLVTDNDPAFPASVLAFAYHALALRSAFVSHLLTLRFLYIKTLEGVFAVSGS